jgi:Uma2 family endonuclease
MGTTTRLTFEEFQALQDAADENVRYELDEGEALLTPSPTAWHGIVAFRVQRALAAFVSTHRLGLTVAEADFRLAPNVVRKPDVAFIDKEKLGHFDLHRTPLEGAPSLAIEVISPSNLAQDTVKKVRQYLSAGTLSVWLIYPALQLVEIHDGGFRAIKTPEAAIDERPFAGLKFSIALTELFDENPER